MRLQRLGRSLIPGLAIALVGLATRPLGALAGTALLVVTLPPLAASLEVLGWASIVADRIGRPRRSPSHELVGAYAAWLASSAVLTLDVAAVVAVPVGLRLAAGRSERSARDHLGAAILGSNLGSLLFPFSNLTNLLLVSATGISFSAYVGAAVLPQLIAAVGGGALLVYRTHRRAARYPCPSEVETSVRDLTVTGSEGVTPLAIVAGSAAVAGAIWAVVVGLAGGDVAPIFAIASAVVVGCAIGSGRPGTHPLDLARSIPTGGLAIVLVAGIAVGPMRDLASYIPDPMTRLPQLVALPMIAIVGGVLAATVNNLPAAAFGAFWLGSATPDVIIAFLIGTNVFAIGTPHGSLATILCRRLAARNGITVGTRIYLATAWRYASAAGLPALAALLITSHTPGQ